MQGIRIEDGNFLDGLAQAKEKLNILDTDSKPNLEDFENIMLPLTWVKAKKSARPLADDGFKKSLASRHRGFHLKKMESIGRKLDIDSFDLTNTISPVGYTDLGSLPPPERRKYGSNRRASCTPSTVGQHSRLRDPSYTWAPHGLGGITIESGDGSSASGSARRAEVLDLAQIEHDANIRQTFRAFLSHNEQCSYLKTRVVNPKYNRALAAAMDAKGWAQATRNYKKDRMLSQAMMDVCQPEEKTTQTHDRETSPMSPLAGVKLSTSHGEVTLTLDDGTEQRSYVESLRGPSPPIEIPTVVSPGHHKPTQIMTRSPRGEATPETLAMPFPD